MVCTMVLSIGFALIPGPGDAHTSDAKIVNATITGLGTIAGDFEFLDDDGRLRRITDLQGNVVSVFFGFTNCPDVCAGFMAKAAAVREMLGDRKDQFKIVFVTVDPQRDDRDTLKRYLRLFGEGSIGARLLRDNHNEVLKLFAVSSQRFKDTTDGHITISHSVGAFLFDKNGRPAAYISGAKKTTDFIKQVEDLLDA